jgi:sugar-specific transcriptional regulator TrmB
MSVIEEARDLLQGRLAELQGEAKAIEKSLKGLAETNGHAARRRPAGRPRKAPGTSRAVKAASKVGKRRGGGRADQAVALITKKPGISASDVAKTMKIKPNYLYRVLGDLETEGRVRKDGRNYFPVL